MAATPRIAFEDHLPEPFTEEGAGFLQRFLAAFEDLFEEMEAEVEGVAGGNAGGIPDLFGIGTTPPPELSHRTGGPDGVDDDLDFLAYVAAWVGIPVRQDVLRLEDEADTTYRARRVQWNRSFVGDAIRLTSARGSLPGTDGLLRSWLRGELWETTPPLEFLTDLGRAYTDVDAVLQLGERATLGVDTVLGEGAPFFFLADLVTDPTVKELRNPAQLDTFERAAQALLDAERPAHTYYRLAVRAHTMRLADPGQTTIQGEPGAQVGVTTLLWDDAWVHDSDT